MGKKRIKTIQADKIRIKQAKKAIKKRLPRGRFYINATYNNTRLTLTDLQGNVVAWSSAGKLGFKGAKKSTPYAASMVVKDVLEKIKTIGLQKVEIYVRGIGPGRDAGIREIVKEGLEVNLIKDITPIPHGGCRPPKPRRV